MQAIKSSNLLFNNSINAIKYNLPSIFNASQKRLKHYALLNSRGLIRVKGEDSTKYLHSIITNNVEKNKENVLYADFLTNKGRVICDSFVYKIDNKDKSPEYLIDVDKSLVPYLLKYLKRYILRSDIHLFNASKNLKVWSVWKSDNETEEDFNKELQNNIGVINAKDPRCPSMGYRIVGKKLENSELFTKSTKQTEDDYKVHRILNGIPEGPKELIKNTSFPFEANLDFLNGVDYHKGCYIGQELTYRTHKRGVTRKRLIPVQFYKENETEPEKLAVDTKWEKSVVEPGVKLTPCEAGENENRIKNIYRDGIYNLGMALVNVDLFKNGEKKTTLFSFNTKDNQKLFAKAFLPNYIDLTKKEEKTETEE